MKIRSSRLDPTSLAYLQEIEYTRGAGANGVFVPRTYQATNPRAGWLAFSLVAVVALGIAASLCRPSVVEGSSLAALTYWQAGLTGFGVLLLLIAAGRLLRKVSPPPFRSAFLYADALHLWDANPDRVTVTNLQELEDVDGYHSTAGGTYLSSRVVLKFLGHSGRQELLLYRRDAAEELLRFLSCLSVLRRSTDEGTRELMQTTPALLGAVARRLTDEGSAGELDNLNIGPDLPCPSEVDGAASSATRRSAGRVALPWLAGAAVAAVGVFGFPWLDNYVLDEHLFSRVPARDTGKFEALDHYLERFPGGRHADEVRDLRDDRRYALALRDAEGKHSPSYLRRYLADAGNTRHRREAQVRINRFYDEVITGLKARARVPGAKIDRQMFDAVLALLEALKKTDRPVVTIGFKATQDPLPVTEEQKFLEKFIYDLRLKEHAVLADLAKRSKEHTAILPLGDVFKPEQTAKREQVILSRLRAALQKALGADILTLELAAPGQKPVIEVAYHTFAPGRLYLYTLTTESPRGLPTVSKTIKGLLRGYEVKWTITIRPPQTKQRFECRFPSAPASNLNYDSKAGDPDWAPYAIILYSGFFDMSSRLIRNFALEPGPAPASFSFRTVTAKES